jgi:high-affinity iron transporter
MLAALIIVFREVIEAGLIVGIVLAVTRGVPGRGLWVTGGLAAGVAGAGLVAAFAGALSAALAGMGQEVFNAGLLALAVVMLTWHNVWMSRHGRELAAQLRAVGQDVVSGSRSLLALAIVVAVAVLREGSEVVLFLYGVAAADTGSSASLLAGGLIGLAMGATLSLLTYHGLIRIPGKALFQVTGILIALIAAGMAAQSVAFLEQAGVVSAFGETLWDTSGILPASSWVGRLLHILVGYNDRPSGLQVLTYVATLIAIALLMIAASPRAPKHPARTVAAE